MSSSSSSIAVRRSPHDATLLHDTHSWSYMGLWAMRHIKNNFSSTVFHVEEQAYRWFCVFSLSSFFYLFFFVSPSTSSFFICVLQRESERELIRVYDTVPGICVLFVWEQAMHMAGERPIYTFDVYSRTIANDVLSLLTFTQCIIIIMKAKLAVSVLSFTIAIFFSLSLSSSPLFFAFLRYITMCGEKILCSSPELSEKFPFNHFLARHGNYFHAYIVHNAARTHTHTLAGLNVHIYDYIPIQCQSVSGILFVTCEYVVCCAQKRRTLAI